MSRKHGGISYSKKNPDLAKFPASLAKPTVLRAEAGDASAIEQLKTWGLKSLDFSDGK
jgi:hypothetical protein